MAVIKNIATLAENQLRKDALAIALAGYAAIDTGAALARKLRIEHDTLIIDEKTFSLSGLGAEGLFRRRGQVRNRGGGGRRKIIWRATHGRHCA
jgi:hypothetical protein